MAAGGLSGPAGVAGGSVDALRPGGRGAVRLLSLHADEPCGDAALLACFDAAAGAASGRLLAIVDGLGHGAPAARAAQAALAVIEAQPQQLLPVLFAALDAALTATRGAAIGLARIEGPRLRYAGLGNTRALRWRGERWLRLSSQYGIVGGGLPAHIEVTDIDLLPGDWLLLFTDGLDEMLQPAVRLPEWEREPALLCEHLLAHWRNPRDDAGVLAWHVTAA